MTSVRLRVFPPNRQPAVATPSATRRRLHGPLVGLGFAFLLAGISGGCPSTNVIPSADIVARISVSSTRGPAPLRVVVNGDASSSIHGEIAQYHWDFGGQASAETPQAEHTFGAPGLFKLTLTVTDESGVSASSTTNIFVGGTSDNEPAAVIITDVDSGKSPLTVSFDGRSSSVPNDEVRDYYWDFNDGSTSRLPAVIHTFVVNGSYTVSLRVVSAGGLEASTTNVITVGGKLESLDFNGSQQATLPFADAGTLGRLTFETWFRADAGGGTAAAIGANFSVQILPDEIPAGPTTQPSTQPATQPSTQPTGVPGVIRITTAGLPHTIAAPQLDLGWKHLAISHDSAGTSTVYVNGIAVGTFDGQRSIPSATLVIGSSFRGRLAEVRLWATSRSGADIAAAMNDRLDGSESSLIGHWPIWESSGQVLGNTHASNLAGYLGTTPDLDVADPTWSGDGPSLP